MQGSLSTYDWHVLQKYSQLENSQKPYQLQKVLQIAEVSTSYRIFWNCRRVKNFTEGLRQKVLPKNSAEASAEETFV